MHHEHTAELAY